ncbi:MAG TPA: RHS repeat-associated core domain-containing protein, partial [Thermoanaerobaculia bacterium]|nr:RHS repeat-associated core domain-containing protein [Thermoanaerobaculia bacterium]
VAPSDECRTLFFDNDTGGWVLADLDGDLFFFDSQGRWYRSEDRNGNAWVGTLDGGGRLASVAFPDGQSETFTYDAAGRLAAITQVGVGGAASRTWSYEWSGPDLIRIRYPDGRARRFEYRAANGFMTHQILEGASGALRTEQAWSYDDQGNVVRAWRGAANFTDAGAVEKWELAYDDPDLPTETTVTDPLGGIAVYTVGRDTVSRKPKVLSVSGACPVCGSAPDTSFVYDATHPLRVAMETSPGGTRTDFTYDALGQVTSRVEAATAAGHPHLPRMTEWEYDTTFPALVTRIAGPAPVGSAETRIAEMTHDATTGDLLSRTVSGLETTHPGGLFALTTSYSGHNAGGGVGAVDPPGYGTADRTLWTYDVPGRNGQLADSRTDPLVGTWTFGYDAFNRRTTVTDPNGVTTTTAYDALDRVTSVTQGGDPGTSADDRVTTYTYNRLGDLYCVKSPTGGGTEHLYDAAGRLVELRRGTAVTTPSATSCLTISSSNIAERQRWSLDGAGHRVNQKLERGTSSSSWTLHSETSWEFGSLCHLDRTIERIDAATSAVTEYAYDCDGNLERVWDPLHPRATFPAQPSTTYAYDAIGRLIATTQPWGGAGGGTVTTSYSYDVQDHLVRVIDGEGTETLYEYSDRDLLTAEESEVSGLTTYVYNDHGELVEETDARLVTVARTVDAADRVTLVEYPDPGLDVGYTYGTSATGWQKGRLLAIARGASTIDFTYNPFGEALTEGDLAYNYDKNGNRTMITYPGGLVATYAYDRMDRHRSLSVQPSTGPAVPVVTASPGAVYRAFGPLASLTLGTSPATTESRGHDLRYAPTSIALSGGRLAWTYTTDLNGNVLAIDDTTPANQDRSFGYQPWQQYLASTLGPWGWYSWTYDRIGNRQHQRNTIPGHFYSYVPNASGGNTPTLAAISFDLRLTRSYEFDGAGFLTRTFAPSHPTEPAAHFTFDAAGTLAALDADGKPLAFAYDGRGLLARAMLGDSPYALPTYSSAGQLLSLHELFFDGSPARRTHLFYFAGRPVAQWREAAGGSGSGTITLLATDHLGTPACALAANATVIWSGGFEPFGRDWQHDTPQGALANGIFLRLPGQWDHPYWHRDLRTEGFGADLFYNVHRWYEPQTGRYVSADPLGLAPGHSLFGYVASRPLELADPLGLFEIDPSCDCPQQPPLGSVPSAIAGACKYLRKPRCQEVLAKYPEARDCLAERCAPESVGKPPLIRCVPNRPDLPANADYCGEWEGSPPAPGVITLFPGTGSCPRSIPGQGLRQTLFHEAVHSCGFVVEDDPRFVEIVTSCTGHL